MKVSTCVSHVLQGDWGVWGTCEEYFAGLTSTNDVMGDVSGADVKEHCDAIRKNWKAKEVREYCETMVEAQNAYWKDKKRMTWVPDEYGGGSQPFSGRGRSPGRRGEFRKCR